jgi:metal-responsive CopG/Arc/MetJ family transcriptional regulator
MSTQTVNVSFQPRLLKEIDAVADRESRSRSELIREAARLYIARRQRWESIFQFGAAQTRRRGLKEADLDAEIRRYRARKGA